MAGECADDKEVGKLMGKLPDDRVCTDVMQVSADLEPASDRYQDRGQEGIFFSRGRKCDGFDLSSFASSHLLHVSSKAPTIIVA